ncbi:universal stress protein [Streptomyces sp. NPDC050844]|uniref:universal stress protein n=1 Tax=Streptomyces sp. NPDC050844 TaxID=3155790 RepID=UPI0034051054
MGARVVVGVSGSLASLAALRAAAGEARRAGRVLVAVIAWEPPEGEGLYARRPDRAWARHWEAEARATLDRAFEEAFGGAPQGVTVERWVVRDRPGRALCGLVEHGDDLLVLGTRRRWSRTGRHVHAHAGCPVMTVPGPSIPKHARRTLRKARAADFSAPAPFPDVSGPSARRGARTFHPLDPRRDGLDHRSG